MQFNIGEFFLGDFEQNICSVKYFYKSQVKNSWQNIKIN